MYYTKKHKQQFIKQLEIKGGNISLACEATKISRISIYAWMEKEPWFKYEVDMIRESVLDEVESALYKNAKEGNVVAQIFILKTQGRKRGYIERIGVEQEIKITEPLKINIIVPPIEQKLIEGDKTKLLND